MMRFSIIIPVYNVGLYLRSCLDSVRSQSHPEWEAICIDDGSCDESPAILDEYARTDTRIRVVHQSNAGEGAARNSALALVTGEYFTFLDGDDLLAPWALQIANAYLQKSGADGMISRPLCVKVRTDAEVCGFLKLGMPSVAVQELASVAEFFKPDHLVLGLVCGRFYSTRKFAKVPMPVGLTMFADLWYWHDIVRIPARWIEVSGAFYGYRMRDGSAVHSDSPRRSQDAFTALIHALENVTALPGATTESVDGYWRRHRDFALSLIRSFFALSKGLSRQEILVFVSKMDAVQLCLHCKAYDFICYLLAWCGRNRLPYIAVCLVLRLDWLRGGLVSRLRRLGRHC